MSALRVSTRVSFPQNGLIGIGIVQIVESREPGVVIVVDATPFHPVDHTWPDQPGDQGTIEANGQVAQVAEAVMAAVSVDGEFAIGEDIPAKRGADGWTWLVGHRVDGEAPDWLVEGARVSLSVDASRRSGLSRGHTACHLASLALDLAVADLWRKDPGSDALGSPNFEARANQSSRIHEDGAVDEYRLGKSLRKSGFDTETFALTLAEREARINAKLNAWVASAAASRVVVEGPTIVDRRSWQCDLPEGTAEILCGGTHVASLAEFSSITVSLDLSDPQLLVMTTRAVAG
jgi:alanyl-tRNA synthetase